MITSVSSENGAAAKEWDWLSTLLTFNEPLRAPTRGRLGHDVPLNVGVVGGGTAGYLAALTFARRLPHAKVTVIESPEIPPIGVGEATVPMIQWFLHHFLGIDPVEFYREVQPTWKLGIRFEWGQPAPYHFQAPFDWHLNNVGLAGSLRSTRSINTMTVGAVLMEHDVTPILTIDDRYQSLLHLIRFAYHFDVGRLLEYLRTLLMRSPNITYRAETIADIQARPDGTGLESLRTGTGETLTFDLYVDCSGFRSLLLEKALGIKYISYADSLFTDRALVFNLPNGERPKPYTSAVTMNAGWTWMIPQRDDDHCGYVHCSAACSPDEARDEVARVFPGSVNYKIVNFRSGRHEAAWHGNVVAVGNSYAFVEPLESTGLLMIIQALRGVVDALPMARHDPSVTALYNRRVARQWDALRWFLSVHYKFNRQKDTAFWRSARSDVNISGAEPVVSAFRGGAPLRFRERVTRDTLLDSYDPVFYGLAGYDCILLGQGVPVTLMESPEEPSDWQVRAGRVTEIARRFALDQATALHLIDDNPQLLSDTFVADGSWTQLEPAI
jgi:tryptophan halogenase